MTHESGHPLIVIIGATCSKKSALASQIHSMLGYPIVNCDLYKAYQYTDIWVNQISNDKLKNPNYHLYQFIDPFTVMNAAIFQKIARKKITTLLLKSPVILLGGSGLYMNSIIFNEYKFHNVGKQKRPKNFTNYFPHTKIIGLKWDQQELYRNINQRVDKYMNNSLEIPKLIYFKYKGTALAKAIGYREWFDYFNNQKSITETLELIKKNTRNYAKRQLTWYRHQYQQTQWYPITNNSIKEVFQKIIGDIKKWKK